MGRLRGSRLRHVVVLAPLLGIELGLSLLLFPRDLLGFGLPLFLAGAAATTGAYAILVHRWPLTRGAWARFALCLALAFVAFQVGVIAFALLTSALLTSLTHTGGGRDNTLAYVLLVVLGGNILFFPVWLLLGGMAYALLRLTEPPPPPSRPAPAPPRRSRR